MATGGRSHGPLSPGTGSPSACIRRLNPEFWGVVPAPGGALSLQHSPVHKGRLCPGYTAHLGLGAGGRGGQGLLRTQHHSESGTNAPVCAVEAGGSAVGAEVLMGLLPALPMPAPQCSSLSPETPASARLCTLPPRPWPQTCPALQTSLSGLGLWFCLSLSFMWLGSRAEAWPGLRRQGGWGRPGGLGFLHPGARPRRATAQDLPALS